MWTQNEPRLHIPILAEPSETYIDFAANHDFKKRTLKGLARVVYYYIKKIKNFKESLFLLWCWIFQPEVKYRFVILDSHGKSYLGPISLKEHQRNSSFSFKLSDYVRKEQLKPHSTLVIIGSRGRVDRWSSSPGNVSVKFVTPQSIYGYRTGFFARQLNARKGHFGFTGVNPKVILDSEYGSKVMLVNHSSKPEYDQVLNPRLKIFNLNNEFLEAEFGKIEPHSYRIVDLEEIIPGAQELLKKTDGLGMSVIEEKGSSLASYHLVYNKKTGSIAMDHSRPSQSQLLRTF